jgi:hypothetical protein
MTLPLPPAAQACADGTLAAEFPGWQIGVIPGALGMWAAYWQSGDGRHRRLIVAQSGPELLAKLRTVGFSSDAAQAPQADGGSGPAPSRPNLTEMADAPVVPGTARLAQQCEAGPVEFGKVDS